MRNFETVEDIIFFAIESEIQSVEFYNRLSEAAVVDETRSLFLKLMEEEKGHIVRLQYLLDHQLENGFPALKNFFSDESYLPHVIPSPDVTVEEGLIIAIQKEQAAMRLYKDLAIEVKKDDLTKLFLSMAAEEEKHLLKFENEYNALLAKK